MRAISVIVLGGLGSFSGVIIGGLILGLAENFIPLYTVSAIQSMISNIILVGVLFIKPWGLFGEKER